MADAGWLDDQQRMLAESVRTFCARVPPGDQATEAVAMTRLAEPGWTGLAMPETVGGAGAGNLELALVLEQLGRVLLRSAFTSSIGVALPVLAQCAPAYPEIERIIAGHRVAVLAFEAFDADAPPSAVLDDDGRTVTGELLAVTDGDAADLFVVPAAVGGEVALTVVERNAARVETVEQVDLTRGLARVGFERAPAAVLARDAAADVRRGLDRAGVALAAEQVGGAARCLDLATSYAQVREQFGRKIGSFQAVAHLCADMLVAVRSAEALVFHAARGLDEDAPDASELASLALATASDAYTFAADATMHVHGGIGFTWEHESHWHLRRAMAQRSQLGSPDHHYLRAGRAVLSGETR